MALELRTIGHATMVLLKDGEPLLATDPWLVGSAYWRSWWLEKYPTAEEIELVRRARELYITHSHPDHFHWPSLRHLGKRSTLHPRFPIQEVPRFLEGEGFRPRVLEPWRWHPIDEEVRIASVPTPIDDSLLVVDTPDAAIVNINDANARIGLLECVRDRLLAPGKPVIALRSYSPASPAAAMFRNGHRIPMKAKAEYAAVARKMAEALGASHFVPFASQAFFDRSDSRWANEYKVTYEDLEAHWGASPVQLCAPFVTMDLATRKYSSRHGEICRVLPEEKRAKVIEREREEARFALPDDFDGKLAAYMKRVMPFRALYRRGIGWRLATSGAERFYDTRKGTLGTSIPAAYDLVITVPDKVLYEALCNEVLTDLGITMIIAVDTQVSAKRTYLAFLLMGLRDYGYFRSVADALAFARFYAPTLEPRLLRLGWKLEALLGGRKKEDGGRAPARG